MSETIIRPFETEPTSPSPFTTPGEIGVPLVRVQVGLKGGSKTFSYSYSATTTTYILRVHKERASVADENA